MLEHLIDASLNAAPISPLTICPSVSERWGSLLESSTPQEKFYVFPRPFSMTREKFSAIPSGKDERGGSRLQAHTTQWQLLSRYFTKLHQALSIHKNRNIKKIYRNPVTSARWCDSIHSSNGVSQYKDPNHIKQAIISSERLAFPKAGRFVICATR